MKMRLILAGALSVLSLPAIAENNYVLLSDRWSARQEAAIASARGRIVFSHTDGVAVAASSNPDFLKQAMASGAFTSGELDAVVQWQKPLKQVDLQEASAVNPGNDPLYFLQWAPRAIQAPEAWALGYSGQGVRVAVLDGGLYAAHVDLAANVDVAASRSFVPGQPFDLDTGAFWHGTHVAGIIAAVDNNLGVVGIAPKATLIGVKVLHGGSGSFSGLLQAIYYATTPRSAGGAGAQIINMSLGAYFPKNATGGGALVAALNRALNFASRQNVLAISAAGNDELDFDKLANVMNVPAESGTGLAVSATGPLGWAYGATNFSRFASYSNYGTSLVSLAAPGGDFAYPGNEACSVVGPVTITTACWVFDMVLSTSRGSTAPGSYSWAAGTSMAAPAAAAVAALILEKNPFLSVGALKNRLMQSATDEGKPGHDPFYGRGWVNALNAVTK